MPTSMPKSWWDTVLDGRIFIMDVVRSGFGNIQAFRLQCYKEADKRRCVITTRKLSPKEVIFQAWGDPDSETMERFTPNLIQNKQHAIYVPEVERDRIPSPPRQPGCSCGYGPRRHLPSCTMTARPAPLGPAPEEPVRALTQEEEDELLLGPCTCGQAPTCLPSCARAGGESDPELAVMESLEPASGS